MTNKVLKQRGRNNKYPDEIWTWRLGEIVPEWLSDIAKVSYLEGQDGNIQLEIVSSSTGGYELKESRVKRPSKSERKRRFYLYGNR